MQKYDKSIINKINFLVHVPKFDEDYNGYKINVYNHGFFYAFSLSKELNIPFYADLLIENKDCDKRDSNRFSISSSPERIKGKNIMIVDDVFTNGDTKDPIAKMLKEVGASEVYIGVIARTKQ